MSHLLISDKLYFGVRTQWVEGRQLLSDWPVSPKIQIFPKIKKEQLLQVCVVWIWFSFLSLKSLLHIQLQWLKIGKIYLYEFSVKWCLSGAGRPHKNSQWPHSRLRLPQQQQQRFVLEFELDFEFSPMNKIMCCPIFSSHSTHRYHKYQFSYQDWPQT